jgi:3-phenylpropionate/trans-cinnamate dioxygenase ferredoxin subunit
MGKFVEVAKVAELQDGTMREVLAGGHEILLAKVVGNYYAVSNRCTHMKGQLSHGTLQGTVVTCPRHGSQFDLNNGQVVRWMKGPGLATSVFKVFKPPRPLTVYSVKIEKDAIMVEI